MTAQTSRLQDLVKVAQESSSEKRRAFLRDITDVYAAAPDKFTLTERQHFDVIMSRVAEQVDAALRREIALKLSHTRNAPKGLIQLLANDEITVAEPLLRHSLALSQDDLAAIIRERGQKHMKAISERRTVPEKLTAALVERGDETVLISLAQNEGARFSFASMKRMVAHARQIKALQTPMTAREDVPAQLLTEMYFFVSSRLKREILKRSDKLDPAVIDEAVDASRRKILADAVRNAKSEIEDARQFIADKIRANAVNESLLKALVDGRRSTAFLLAFSHLAGVDASTAQAILRDQTFEAPAVAARAMGLERATFAKIVFALQKSGAEQAGALRILDLYPKIPQDAADRVMRFWRLRARAAPEAPAGEQDKRRAAG